MKNKKKIGIISISIIIVIAIVLFTMHTLNNIPGVYQDPKSGILIDIEKNGVGYFYEENAAIHIDTTLTWKKIEKNNYQIQFNANGNTTTFNATKKNNKLETQKGIYWRGGTFDKTNENFNDAKKSIYNKFNVTAKSIYDSNTENVWLEVTSTTQYQGAIPNGNAVIDHIIITKNGQYKKYKMNAIYLSSIIGKSPKSVIEYAKRNSKSVSNWRTKRKTSFAPTNQPIAFSSKSGIKYTGTAINYQNNDNLLDQFVLVCPTKPNEAVPTIHF